MLLIFKGPFLGHITVNCPRICPALSPISIDPIPKRGVQCVYSSRWDLGEAVNRYSYRDPIFRELCIHEETPLKKKLFPLIVFVISFLGLFFFLRSTYASVKIIPLDTMTMIDPQRGVNIVGNGTYGDNSWTQSNPVWDGKTIRLKGAKGETISFQIMVIRKPSDIIKNIRMELALGKVTEIKLSRAWGIWGTPEIAVPLTGIKYHFDFPSSVPLEKEGAGDLRVCAWPLWVEFTLPRHGVSGVLKGTISISAESGMQTVCLPLELTAYPFELPLRPHLTVEMNSYGDYTRLLKNDIGTYLALHRLLHDYRCTFIQVPYRQDGSPSGTFFFPRISEQDGETVLHWTAFDSALSGLFDGTAFSDSQPLTHFILPLNYNWPVSFWQYRVDRAMYKGINISVRSQIAHHIQERGWNSTFFQEFHNENPSSGANLPWHLDEPRSAQDMDGHAFYTQLLAKALHNFPGTLLRYRIDISRWQNIKEEVSRLAPAVTDWSVSWNSDFLSPQSASLFRSFADTHGGMLLGYGEVAGFMTEGKPNNWSLFDRYALLCWTLNLDGFAQWQIDRWQQKDLTDKRIPEEAVPLFYSSAAGARDLIWPGIYFAVNGPLPSLRLKAIRESLNLFDYAYLAMEQLPDKRQEINTIISGLNTETADSHFKIKEKLAEMISAQHGEH